MNTIIINKKSDPDQNVKIEWSNYTLINSYPNNDIEIYIPNLELDEIKEVDYKRGYIYRYFFKQANNPRSTIFEISKKEYDKLSSILFYKRLKMKWKIIGTESKAREINSENVERLDKEFNGLKSLLSQNYLKYWKNLPDNIININITSQLNLDQEQKKGKGSVSNINI